MDEPTTPVLVAGTIQVSFKFFSRLPAEVQLDIWESAISDLDPYVATMYTTGSLCHPKTPEGVLSLLRTCITSRKAVMKMYKPLFISSSGKSLYFNSSKDIFHIADIDTLADVMDRALGSRPKRYKWDYDQVKNLAIRIDDKEAMNHLKEIKNWLAMMKNLKTFVLPGNLWSLSRKLWKDKVRQIQSHWKKTQGLNQRGLQRRKEIEPPKFILMDLGKFSQRYSEGIKLDIKLALEE
jgi:hypothetical protein